MEYVTRLQRNLNKFLTESLEDSKQVAKELERLEKENYKLMSQIQKYAEEKAILTEKLQLKSCANCDIFRLKAKNVEEKMNLVYKALCPILGLNAMGPQLEQIVTQKLFPHDLGVKTTERSDLKTAVITVKTTDCGKAVPNHQMPEDNINNLQEEHPNKPRHMIVDRIPEEDVEHQSTSSQIAEGIAECQIGDGVLSEDAESFLCIADPATDEMLKEVVDLSSVDMDSQFMCDAETPGLIKETPIKKVPWSKSGIAEQIIRELLGPSQPSKDVLAPATPEPVNGPPIDDRPEQFVPETMAQVYNEKTPTKSSQDRVKMPARSDIHRRSSQNIQDVLDTGGKEKPVEPCSPTRVRNMDRFSRNNSQLISPSRVDSVNSISPSTPKRKRSSPRRLRSPYKKQPLIKRSNRTEAEYCNGGIRRMTQTQLNVNCFKKPVHPNLKAESVVVGTPSPLKCEDDDVVLESPTARRSRGSYRSPPLTEISNYGDMMDETLLSLSAMQRVASDVVRKVLNKREIACSYDNVPGVELEDVTKRKDLRKMLPGQECPECEKFYNVMGEGDIERKQQLMDQCSRHRMRKVITSDTPPGFWKPMISQTPDEPMLY